MDVEADGGCPVPDGTFSRILRTVAASNLRMMRPYCEKGIGVG